MENNGWTKQIMTWSPEGRRQGQCKIKVRKESGKGDEAEKFNT
jgi:hypothetical protein